MRGDFFGFECQKPCFSKANYLNKNQLEQLKTFLDLFYSNFKQVFKNGVYLDFN